MPEIVKCDKCGATYEDRDSVEMVKRWKDKDGYAPCPNISCSGQLKVEKKEDRPIPEYMPWI